MRKNSSKGILHPYLQELPCQVPAMIEKKLDQVINVKGNTLKYSKLSISVPYSELLESPTFVPAVANSVRNLSDVNFADVFSVTTRTDTARSGSN